MALRIPLFVNQFYLIFFFQICWLRNCDFLWHFKVFHQVLELNCIFGMVISMQVHPYTYRNENQFLHLNFHQDPYQEYEYWINKIGVDGLFTDFTGSLNNYQEWTSSFSLNNSDDRASKLLHKIALMVTSYEKVWKGKLYLWLYGIIIFIRTFSVQQRRLNSASQGHLSAVFLPDS